MEEFMSWIKLPCADPLERVARREMGRRIRRDGELQGDDGA